MTAPEWRDPGLRIRARMALVASARDARERGSSAAEWAEMALESEAGTVAGERELDAVMRVVWGIGGMRMVR